MLYYISQEIFVLYVSIDIFVYFNIGVCNTKANKQVIKTALWKMGTHSSMKWSMEMP